MKKPEDMLKNFLLAFRISKQKYKFIFQSKNISVFPSFELYDDINRYYE